MDQSSQERVNRRATHWKSLAWVTFAAGLVVTLLTWYHAARTEQLEADAAFKQAALDSNRRLTDTIERQVALLGGFQSLFLATESVSRTDFHRHYATRDIDSAFPGLLAVQYARLVPPAAQPGVGAERLVVNYVEPAAANTELPNYDHFAADDERRAAALDARDAGKPIASPPLTLVAGKAPHARGLVIFAPIYRPQQAVDSVEQRRAAFSGVIVAAIATDAVLASIAPTGDWSELRWQVRDIGRSDSVTPGTAKQSLFDTAALSRTAFASDRPPADNDRLVQTVHVAGRRWELTLTRPAVHPLWRPWPLALLAGGIVASLGLSLALRTLATRYSHAMRLAQRLSSHARASEKHLRSVLDNTVDGIVTFNEAGTVLGANTAISKIFGVGEDQLVGQALSRLIPSIRSHGLDQSMEDFLMMSPRGKLDSSRRRIEGRRQDGSTVPLELAVSTMDNEGEKQYVGILRDLSSEQLAEESFLEAQRQLSEVDEMRRVIVHNAPYAIFVLNRHGVIQTVNPAGEALLGYKSQDLIGQSTTERFFDPEEVKERARMLALRLNRPVEDLQVLAHLAGESPGVSSEWTLVRADGRHLTAEISVTLLHNEADQMTGYLAMASDVSSRREAENQLQHLALHDSLTGLPNRNMLQEQLKASLTLAERDGNSLALMFLDLDRFKKINDTLGHHIGDSMLIEVARRLRSEMRTSDIVARLGGDEFVILLPRIALPEDGEVVAQKVLELFIEPLRVGPHELRVTPSVGLVIYPAHGHDAITLMRHADLAMYQAKSNGRNRVQMYTDVMESPTLDTLRLENDLYKALERDELRLHYQPQFDCMSGRITGAEALVRWEHGGKLVPPADFIPLAEETGLIIPMGEWVLRRACAKAQAWRERSGWPMRIAVNLSAIQLDQVDIVSLVAQVLQDTGLPATALELEITESVVVRESLRAAAILTQLRALGVAIAIDDFGVGYSSFSYLRELPVDRLKMDRSFLVNVPESAGDSRLAAALIAMAHRLEVGIIAEGVETEEQHEFLRAHGCDESQGYHLGRPMAEPAFEALLMEHSRNSAAKDALAKINALAASPRMGKPQAKATSPIAQRRSSKDV
ncbi:MAG: EAL domain-containing protein [Burkholderiales bacterium]|nr:EAL domain-containing protein [Burkholderiales bacterium]